ncbi:MAG: deoxyribose-phosphate aldolase [Planctomycetia bacterium]|nr:deoxyribose-phosphate aldolase [Planctomycetia bacterium]
MKISIPQLMDLSAVQTSSTKADVVHIAAMAAQFDCKATFCLSCFTPVLHEERDRLGARFLIGGTVGYPSGQMTTAMKVAEARELMKMNVDEVDMMINDGFLLSGMYDEVVADIRSVKEIVGDLPLKVIVEAPVLTLDELRRAAELVVKGGAQWIKTGTGWAKTGTTLEHLIAIKEAIGDSLHLKVAGGVSSLTTIRKMLPYGVERFGIGRSAGAILNEYASEGSVVFDTPETISGAVHVQ